VGLAAAVLVGLASMLVVKRKAKKAQEQYEPEAEPVSAGE
jgi:hypothetical protein